MAVRVRRMSTVIRVVVKSSAGEETSGNNPGQAVVGGEPVVNGGGYRINNNQ